MLMFFSGQNLWMVFPLYRELLLLSRTCDCFNMVRFYWYIAALASNINLLSFVGILLFSFDGAIDNIWTGSVTPSSKIFSRKVRSFYLLKFFILKSCCLYCN